MSTVPATLSASARRPPPTPLWAVDQTGWPIYAAQDTTTGIAEQLQLNARGDVVTLADTVIPCNIDGMPMDGPDPSANKIIQPNTGIHMRDFCMNLTSIAYGAPPVLLAPPTMRLVPGAGPVLPTFALNPGQIAMTTVMDYSSSKEQRLFCKGIKSLYSDSNKFALTSDWIQSFLQSLKAHGSLNGWNFSVNVGTPAVAVYNNLIDSYGEITLENIHQTVKH
jgi:hypothetical protein